MVNYKNVKININKLGNKIKVLYLKLRIILHYSHKRLNLSLKHTHHKNNVLRK